MVVYINVNSLALHNFHSLTKEQKIYLKSGGHIHSSRPLLTYIVTWTDEVWTVKIQVPNRKDSNHYNYLYLTV